MQKIGLSGVAIPDPKPTEQKDEIIHLVSFKSGMIGVNAPFEEKDRCKALSTRRWEKPYWVCPASIIEEVATAFADGVQSDGFKRVLAEQHDNAAPRPIPTNLDLGNFGNGKTMMPYQLEGVAKILSMDIKSLVADEMGLGKTVEALAVLAVMPKMRPAIVVCPASLKLNWEQEANAWLETDENILVVKNGKAKTIAEDVSIVIINYEVLKKWLPELQKMGPQILILDESHAVKNPKAARSKAAKELASTTPHRLLLTGTPVLHRPSDIRNQLEIIDPISYNKANWFSWHMKYADAKQLHFGRKSVWDFSGASNLDELAKSLEPIMIRRTKAEVLPELPAKRRTTVLIPIDNRKEYDRANKEFADWITDLKGDAASSALNAEQIAKREYLKQLAIQGKIKESIAWIDNFLESGEKLIVFATHKATVHALERQYGNIATKVVGGMSADAKNASVEAFQNDPNVRLFIGNIQAAGVGYTLTAASHVAFLELPDGPEMIKQCEDRAHRIGQTNAVNIYFLLAERTIDSQTSSMVDHKNGIITHITGDGAGQGFNLFTFVKGV